MAASQPFWTRESRKLVYSLKASYTTSLPNFILIRGTTAKLWTQTCQNLGIFSNFRQKKSNIFVKNHDIENPKRTARSWGCLLSPEIIIRRIPCTPWKIGGSCLRSPPIFNNSKWPPVGHLESDCSVNDMDSDLVLLLTFDIDFKPIEAILTEI